VDGVDGNSEEAIEVEAVASDDGWASTRPAERCWLQSLCGLVG